MSHRGFTLIEVLVALVVVALGAAAVMISMSSAADTTARLRDRAVAEWVAANRIAETRLEKEFPAVGRTQGIARMANRDWQWRQEVRQTSIDGVVQILVEVRPAGSADDWLTLSGARGRDILVDGEADTAWDTADRSSP